MFSHQVQCNRYNIPDLKIKFSYYICNKNFYESYQRTLMSIVIWQYGLSTREHEKSWLKNWQTQPEMNILFKTYTTFQRQKTEFRWTSSWQKITDYIYFVLIYILWHYFIKIVSIYFFGGIFTKKKFFKWARGLEEYLKVWRIN